MAAEVMMKVLHWCVISWLYFPLQELMEYICQLEQKMGTVASAKWSATPIASTGEWSHTLIYCMPCRCEQ